MKKRAFVVTAIGFSVLLMFVLFQKPVQINSPEELSSLVSNKQVATSGRVVEQSNQEDGMLLTLDNNIEVFCLCKNQNLAGKNISVLGRYDSFRYDKIKVLEISLVHS